MMQYWRSSFRSFSLHRILPLAFSPAFLSTASIATAAELRYTGNKTKPLTRESQDLKFTVHVRKIPIWANVEEVKQCFGELASGILTIDLIRQQHDKSIGEAYVKFANDTFYRQALESDKKLKIPNTECVFDVSPLAPSQCTDSQNLGLDAPFPEKSQGVVNRREKAAREDSRGSEKRPTQFQGHTDCVLHLSRLPRSVTTVDQVKKLLPDSGAGVDSVQLVHSRYDQSFTHTAFVLFSKASAYENAIHALKETRIKATPSTKALMTRKAKRTQQPMRAVVKLRLPIRSSTYGVVQEIFTPLHIRDIQFLRFEGWWHFRSAYVGFNTTQDAEKASEIVKRLSWKWMPSNPAATEIPVQDLSNEPSGIAVLRLHNKSGEIILDEHLRSTLHDCVSIKKIHVADPKLNGLRNSETYIELSDAVGINEAFEAIKSSLKKGNYNFFIQRVPPYVMEAALWKGKGKAHPVIGPEVPKQGKAVQD